MKKAARFPYENMSAAEQFAREIPGGSRTIKPAIRPAILWFYEVDKQGNEKTPAMMEKEGNEKR